MKKELKQHVKSVLTSLSKILYNATIEMKDGIRKPFLSILLCLLTVYVFPERCTKTCIHGNCQEPIRSPWSVSHDPEPVERSIEVGSQAVCVLLKEKYKPLRWKSSLEHNGEGEPVKREGYSFYRLKRKKIVVLSCWVCISQLREGEWVVNVLWMRWGGCLLCWDGRLF